MMQCTNLFIIHTTVIPKGKTASGLRYSINQGEYLKVFLTDGEVPIDNSASERSLRNFSIGRKNWMTINTIRGAQASAIIYSITETARANSLNVITTSVIFSQNCQNSLIKMEILNNQIWSHTCRGQNHSRLIVTTSAANKRRLY